MESYFVGNVMDDGDPEIWTVANKVELVQRLMQEWLRGERELHGIVGFAFDHGATCAKILDICERNIRRGVVGYIEQLLAADSALADAFIKEVEETVIVMRIGTQKVDGAMPAAANDS